MPSTGSVSDTTEETRTHRTLSPRTIVLLSVALVAVLLLVWQWRSPRAFGAQGDIVGMYNQVGTTALVGVAAPRRDMDPATLTIHSVEPQVVEGDARIDVLVCHIGPGEPRLGTARGARPDRFCDATEQPEGAKLTRDDQLVLRVRSEQPGRIVVRGVKVSYSHGWRRGSQLTGQTVRVRYGDKTVAEHLATQ